MIVSGPSLLFESKAPVHESKKHNTYSVPSLQGKPAGGTLCSGISHPARGGDSGKYSDRLPFSKSALQPSFGAKDFLELSYQGIHQRKQTKL